VLDVARRDNVWFYGHRGRLGHQAKTPSGLLVCTQTLGFKPSCDCQTKQTAPPIVLDPFAGAATTGLACLQAGRSFIGVELSPQYLHLAEQRLRRAMAQRVNNAGRQTSEIRIHGLADLPWRRENGARTPP
jgi:hypothetical protein